MNTSKPPFGGRQTHTNPHKKSKIKGRLCPGAEVMFGVGQDIEDVLTLKEQLERKILEAQNKVNNAIIHDVVLKAIRFDYPEVSNLTILVDDAGLFFVDQTVKQRTTTSAWIEKEVVGGLLDRLARKVASRLPREDFDELRGEAGLCAANWAAQGTFDQILAESSKPYESNMAEWVYRKAVSAMLQRGHDPQQRERHGVKSTVEVRGHRDQDHRIAAETWQAMLVTDSVDGTVTQVIQDRQPTPDQSLEDKLDHWERVRFVQDVLTIKHPKQPVRRLHVMNAILRGAKNSDIQNELGVSPLRVSHMTREARTDIKHGIKMLEHARKVLDAIKIEPWSTRTELSAELKLKKKDINQAITILVNKRLARATPDGAVGPTPAAYNEIL